MGLLKKSLFLGVVYCVFTFTPIGSIARSFLASGISNISSISPATVGKIKTSSQASQAGDKNTKVIKKTLTPSELEQDLQMVNIGKDTWVYWTKKTIGGGYRPTLPTQFVSLISGFNLDAKPQQTKVSDWLTPGEFDKSNGLVTRAAGLGEQNLLFYSGYKASTENILAGSIVLNATALGTPDPGNGKFNLGIINNNNSPHVAQAQSVVAGLDLKTKQGKLESLKRLYLCGWHFSEAVTYTTGMKDSLRYFKEFESPAFIVNALDVWVQFGKGGGGEGGLGFIKFVENYRVLQKMDRKAILEKIVNAKYPTTFTNFLVKDPGQINIADWDTESIRILRARLVLCDISGNCSGIEKMGLDAWGVGPKPTVMKDQVQRMLNIGVVTEADLERIKIAPIKYLDKNS